MKNIKGIIDTLGNLSLYAVLKGRKPMGKGIYIV
jgi:hypothetical protein